MLLSKRILLIMSHKAASSEQEHKKCAISMEAAVPKTMAPQPIYSSLGNTTITASLDLTSPAYLVAWDSKRQRHVLPGMRQDSDGSPGGDSYTMKEV